MKFQSIELIIHQAAKAFRRFPMALICAILAAALMMHLVDDNAGFKENIPMYYILQTLWLGMISFVGLSVFTQRYTMRTSTVILLNVAVVALMVYFFYAQPESYTVKSVSRFIILVIGAHLGVSFAPFLVNTEVKWILAIQQIALSAIFNFSHLFSCFLYWIIYRITCN